MNQTAFTSVLPPQLKANFEISSCTLSVEVDKKIFSGIYTATYKLKKVANNSEEDDSWTEGTSSGDSKLISVLGSNGGSIQTIPVANEGKMAFQVEFLRKLGIGEKVDFTIKYRRPLLRKEVERGFLFKRYLIVVESIYANLCRDFEVEFSFNNEKCILLESIPNRFQTENDIISFKKEILRPHEVYTVGLLLHNGILQRRESKIVSSLFLMIVGGFVSLGISKLFG